jgi:hypothetical protein
VVCCDDEHVAELDEPEAAAEPTTAATAAAKMVLVFMVPGWEVAGTGCG